MPRWAALLDTRAMALLQGAAKNDALRSNFPAEMVGAENLRPLPERDWSLIGWKRTDWAPRAAPDGFRIIHYFDAPDRECANIYFLRMRRDGCPRDINLIGDAGNDSVVGAKVWRFRGDVCYLTRKINAFGLQAVVAKKHVEKDERFRNITNLMVQLSATYHDSQVRKENGVALLPPPRLAAVERTMVAAEVDLAKLIVLASAASEALDGAYAAFGLKPVRSYTTPGLKPERPPVEADVHDGLQASFGSVLAERDAALSELAALKAVATTTESNGSPASKSRTRRGDALS